MKSHLFLFEVIAGFLVISAVAPDAPATEASYRWAGPVELAVANCSQFSWVSDLPMTVETVRLLKRAAVDSGGLSPDRIHSWSNGSAEEFLDWMKGTAGRVDPQSTLVFYFATHQKKDGRTRFTRGSDLAPDQLIQAINAVARRCRRLLFINDSCHAAALEKPGQFETRVIRIYASAEHEVAFDLNFEKGPFGLEDFARAERQRLRSRWDWDPPGMSFLGLIGLQAVLGLTDESRDSIGLQMLLDRMNRARQRYDDQVRQAKVQHFVVAPPDADLEILKKSPQQD